MCWKGGRGCIEVMGLDVGLGVVDCFWLLSAWWLVLREGIGNSEVVSVFVEMFSCPEVISGKT